jgi:small subunit ribosomal protein S20
LPNNKSAEKRNRQNSVRRLRNRVRKSEVRTSNRKLLQAVKDENKEVAEKEFQAFSKLIDTATRKGVYHVNTAARKKSRLQKLLNKLS